MNNKLFEKQISIENLHGLLIQATVLTFSHFSGMGRKEVKKLSPTSSVGMFLAFFNNVSLTDFDMFGEETTTKIACDIFSKAIQKIPKKYR